MTTPKQVPSKGELNRLFKYDDGFLYWREERKRFSTANPVGVNTSRGYLDVTLNGYKYRLHRIIWAWHFDRPEIGMDIDHINKNKSDNRIENLRVVTRSQNLHNQVARRGNKGGCVGVCFVKSKGYWQVTFCVDYKQVYLGSKHDYFEACCLRKSYEAKHSPLNKLKVTI